MQHVQKPTEAEDHKSRSEEQQQHQCRSVTVAHIDRKSRSRPSQAAHASSLLPLLNPSTALTPTPPPQCHAGAAVAIPDL